MTRVYCDKTAKVRINRILIIRKTHVQACIFFFFHKFSVLYQYQFGFRQYHSTSLALIQLCDNVYSHLDQQVVIGMYFDLVTKLTIKIKTHAYNARAMKGGHFEDTK